VAGPTKCAGGTVTGATPVVFDNVIGGTSVAPVAGGLRPVQDPVTGEVYARAAESDAEDIDMACVAAATAFLEWGETTPAERSAAMLRAADLLEANADELTRIEVADTGKPYSATREDELPPIIDQVRFFAGACRVMTGSATGDYMARTTSGIRREPVGVCGQITPWNYPLMMAVWKWAPAIAAGNTVVLKPSELTPASTVRMAELLAEVFPPGVLNVVCGGADTGEALVRHPAVAMVSLTGSPRAGREVARAAADRLTRVHLELGGNAPVVIFGDADVTATAEAVAGAAFFNAGQDCTAATRVLVERPAYEAVVTALSAEATQARTGDPFDPGVTFGPLISQHHLDKVKGLLDRLPDHARVVAGGCQIGRPGFFHQATVVADVGQRDEIVQEEIFGPVITVQPFATETEALEKANDVAQGLCASVWTENHGRAERMCRGLDFGSVSVNTHAPMTAEMPHGGFGGSGYGKDLSMYGLEDYTRIKHVASAW
jgi:betaine-aldehyde dehydrogenase